MDAWNSCSILWETPMPRLKPRITMDIPLSTAPPTMAKLMWCVTSSRKRRPTLRLGTTTDGRHSTGLHNMAIVSQ
eukprot:jgi/Bigna1/50179/estExt_Genewise1.C_680062